MSVGGLDAYNFRARLAPLVVVLVPALAGLAVLVQENGFGWQAASAGVGSAVLAWLGVELARGPGKRKEHLLFRKWGGVPTTILLRHRDQTIDPITKCRLHAKLAALAEAPELPSPESEEVDPEGADAVYGSIVAVLRERTRTADFTTVREANASYGFRRNLWGLKPLGIAVAVIVAIGAGIMAVTTPQSSETIAPAWPAVLAVAVIWCIGWVTIIRPSWVRLAAREYAFHLLNTADRFTRCGK